MNEIPEKTQVEIHARPTGWSLRKKAMLAFLVLIFVIATGMGLTLLNVSNVVGLGAGVIEKRQPAALGSLGLMKNFHLATSLVNGYLLTGQKTYKDRLIELKARINADYKVVLDKFNVGVDKPYRDKLDQAAKLMEAFFNYVDRFFYLHDHDLENYPGLALASETTDPYTLQYLGLINGLIIEGVEAPTADEKYRAMQLLNDLRYSWVQMNNAFRLFFTTRSDNELANFYAYSDVNAQKLKELKDIGIEIGFDSLEQLEYLRKTRLKNTPGVIDIVKSDAWRSDIYILNTEVRPLLNELNALLQNVTDNQLIASAEDGRELAATLDQTYIYAGILFVLALSVVVIIAIVIIRATRPIGQLTEIMISASIHRFRNMNINRKLLNRGDEVGELSRAFNYMYEQLAEAYRQLQMRATELERARNLAEAASRAKTEFLANISHELRTPMHAILSFSEFGKAESGKPDDKNLAKYFTRIHDSGTRLLKLLNALLDLSRLEAGETRIEMREYDLHDVVSECINAIETRLKAAELTIDIEENNVNTVATFDAHKLIQVMNNLLSNAIQFSPHGSRIQIMIEDDSIVMLDRKNGEIRHPSVRISVIDQGKGIPDDELELIFDKFSQSTRTKTGAGGTGLGLSICKGIIEAHSGRIWAENGPEGGAIFRFVIPRNVISVTNLSQMASES